MSKILIATRKENTNTSMNEKLQKELDCEFMSMDAQQLISAFSEKQAKLVVIYLTRLSEKEEIEVSKFLGASKQIPVILVGNREILSGYFEKTNANILRYICTPILLSAYISEIKKVMQKIEESEEALPEEKGKTLELTPPKNILVIDDDIVMLRTINNWLNEFFKVSLARGCIDAFRYFGNNTPDLILLDYDMPGYDGIETLKQIRAEKKLKDIPVFFLTAVDEGQYVEKAISLKPQGYILKSNGADYLISKIQQYL